MKNLNIHGGNIWQFRKSDVLDFSASINPLGLSKRIKEVITQNLDSLVHYPEPYARILTNSFAEFLGVSKKQIAFGNGSMEFIYNLPLVLKANTIGIINPSFSEYEYAARNTGSRILFMNTREDENFRIDIDKLIKFLPKIRLLFLGHPNNPTGQVFNREELVYLVKNVQKNRVYLIVDEVFIDFLKDAYILSLIKYITKTPYVVVIKSLTKLFAIAGLRFGYAAANEKIIEKILDFQYPWSVNTLAQVTALELIKDTAYINKTIEFINAEKDFLYDQLKEVKYLEPFYPSVNFILCRINNKKYISRRLTKDLLKKGILIRDCSNFRNMNDKYFRVAVRTRKENNRLINSLKEILK